MAVLATIVRSTAGAITLKRWGLNRSAQLPGGAEGCDKVPQQRSGEVCWAARSPVRLSGLHRLLLVMALLRWSGRVATANLSALSWWGLFSWHQRWHGVFQPAADGTAWSSRSRALLLFLVLSGGFLSVALFVLSPIGRDWPTRPAHLPRVILALVVGLVGLGWAASVDRPGRLSTPCTPPVVMSAQHPGDRGFWLSMLQGQPALVMLFAYWVASHCHEQKEMFGQGGLQGSHHR